MKPARLLSPSQRIFLRRAASFVTTVLAAAVLAGPAWADWRKELGTFRVGISATDAKQLSPADIEKLKSSFAAALDMPVEVALLRDYPALIDAQVSSRIEYAVYSSASYATAWLLCECVEPLAAPIQSSGATGVRSVLVMNASAIFTRLDLNGIRIGVAGRDSITGFAVPLAEYDIGTRGLSADERFFSFYPGMTETASAFADSKIDGFFGWAFSDADGLINGTGIMGSGARDAFSANGKTLEVKTPWTSSLLRHGPHAVRRNLDAEAKAALRGFLQGLTDEQTDILSILPPHDVARFLPVAQEDYNSAIAAVKAAAASSN